MRIRFLGWLEQNRILLEAVAVVLAFGAFALSAWQVRETRIASKLGQRAWITVDSLETPGLAVGKSPRFKFTLKNSGLTPAVEIESHWRFILSTESLDDQSFGAPEPASTRALLGAGSTAEFTLITIPQVLNEEQVASVTSGKAHVFFLLEIRYGDVFGDRHETSYCAQVTLNYPDYFVPCPTRNTAR